jgi:hypothetical protein
MIFLFGQYVSCFQCVQFFSSKHMPQRIKSTGLDIEHLNPCSNGVNILERCTRLVFDIARDTGWYVLRLLIE